MNKLNESVPELSALSSSITLCEDNTVAIKSVPDDISFVISKNYLEPEKFFIIQIQKVFHEIGDYIDTIVKCCLISDEILEDLPLDQLIAPIFERVRADIDMHMGKLWNLMRSGNMSETGNRILHNLLRHHCYKDVKEPRQNRWFTKGDELLGEYVAICYIQLFGGLYRMYIVCRQGIYAVALPLHMGPKHLLIQMAKPLKQFRTIPLYDVPSLQGLCRGVILKHMKQIDGYLMEERLEQLPLAGCMVKKLAVHAELENGYTGQLTEKPVANLTIPSERRIIRAFLRERLRQIRLWRRARSMFRRQ